ncbi:MAG: efflux RND transporter permease subunit, partial [Actinomycetota bacterium]
AIKRELDHGHPGRIAGWLGPTKLARAIMFATITNIVAYLPFLLLPGDVGRFVRSLPIVLTCSLIASRLVSMTFIPLLGYYLLKPSKKKVETEEPEEEEAPPAEPARKSGFQTAYYRFGGWCLDHRWLALGLSIVLLGLSVLPLLGLRQQFFPKDLSYLSYVDVWLPEDAPLTATNAAVAQAEAVIRKTAEEYGKKHPSEHEGKHDAEHDGVLHSLTSFVGGGGPRFWWSVAPELPQLNYAQLIIQVNDKHVTQHLVPVLQLALSAAIPNARVDVRELESGQPVGIPVSVRISGDDIPTLRKLSEEVQGMMRAIPIADRVRDDWGPENFVVNLGVDSDRANLAGVTNLDVAASSAASMSGVQVSSLREGDKRIPINVRLRAEDRAQLSDIHNLYVHSLTTEQKAPLGQVSSVDYQMQTEKVQRRNQFRTVTVSCFPTVGALPTEVWNQATPKLDKFRKSLPPGYKMEIGGELEKTVESNEKMAVVMLISVCAIFLALVVQFRHAFKPFIVYAAIPYGFAGGMLTLAIMGGAFGFMAFLGLISLIGVIVSHVIVLFDFIEEQHAEGAPLREALLDAGIMRLRPVFITVGATVFGLVPLALHGGPLWEPLCYVQIGGLTAATVITLILVPVLYTICVRDLKIVQWKEKAHPSVEH